MPAKRLLLVLFLLSVLQFPGSAQAQLPPFQERQEKAADPAEARMQKEREKQMNQSRHAALKRDTEKLLQLSTELKQYVDKANENVLSLEVIRKAEQIEKLAHSVREKMKGF